MLSSIFNKNNTFCFREKRLAKKYYDKLYKEYCIADLSRYKENKVFFLSVNHLGFWSTAFLKIALRLWICCKTRLLVLLPQKGSCENLSSYSISSSLNPSIVTASKMCFCGNRNISVRWCFMKRYIVCERQKMQRG